MYKYLTSNQNIANIAVYDHNRFIKAYNSWENAILFTEQYF